MSIFLKIGFQLQAFFVHPPEPLSKTQRGEIAQLKFDFLFFVLIFEDKDSLFLEPIAFIHEFYYITFPGRFS